MMRSIHTRPCKWAIDAPHPSQIRGWFVIVTARNTKADVLWLFRRLTDVFLPEQSGLNETNIDCP